VQPTVAQDLHQIKQAVGPAHLLTPPLAEVRATPQKPALRRTTAGMNRLPLSPPHPHECRSDIIEAFPSSRITPRNHECSPNHHESSPSS
jgi:hypothetical protein